MNFNFNNDRIRGGDGRGQRRESRMDVICITWGKGAGEWWKEGFCESRANSRFCSSVGGREPYKERAAINALFVPEGMDVTIMVPDVEAHYRRTKAAGAKM